MSKTEQFVDQEVRIRLLEHAANDIRKLLWSLIGIGIASIIVPVVLHRYGLT